MKNRLFFILVSVLFFASCAEKSEEENDETTNENFLFNNNLDSIVYYGHESNDVNENEMLLVEKDPALQEVLMNYDFYWDKFTTLNYYYNTKRVFSDKAEVQKLNAFFRLADFSEPDPESEMTILFRDIFLFYSKGKLKGAVKVCFPCKVSAFINDDAAYREALMEQELKVITNTKDLEQFLTGVAR